MEHTHIRLATTFTMRLLITVIITLSLLVASSFTISDRYYGPTNKGGLDIIKEFVRWFPTFYTDLVGVRTIGYGHACHTWDCTVPLNGKYPVPLTLAHGDALLQDDLSHPGRFEGCINNYVRYNLNATQFSALASLVFDIGCENFASSTLLQLLNDGDLPAASQEFGRWTYGSSGGGHASRRREAERALFCMGDAGGCGDHSCVGLVTGDGGGVVIRSTPDFNGGIVGSLSEGATVYIRGRTSGSTSFSWWFDVGSGFIPALNIRISMNNREPWCSSE
ncbi:uncharacterized protein LOC110852223 isoform X2 [Folsomia candida]|uniref:uncharacterized protein LOC110852223 isoform X2 n=1 Tax=Folsomia candida TaxID=158441 RepID=UPI000B8F0D44|nr:uncharacterized protein LOC110852223 isoform X2 [Folsomia candida]